MIDADRRVATLAALFAPQRAAAMLARLATGIAPGVAVHAAQLATAPRAERLRALSGILAREPAAARARAGAVSRRERGRVASLVRDVALGPWAAGPASPIVVRLCRERIWS